MHGIADELIPVVLKILKIKVAVAINQFHNDNTNSIKIIGKNRRIGQGYDAHQFEAGKPLLLGGVQIESKLGLKAHSDGDVAIHALCDALLGAAALGDIGRHFPDTSSDFENIDSRILLRNVIELLRQKNFSVHNADLTIVAQAPKLASYIDPMRSILAMDMNIDTGFVNVKATTTEHMGFVGRKEGIASYAVVLLSENGQ